MTDKNVPDNVHAELLALQSIVVSDIAFFKQQQWQVCNHGLVLYGSIVAIPKLIDAPMNCFEYFLLGLLAFAILVFGIWLVLDIGKSLAKGRDRLPALRKHFDRDISLKAYAAGGDPAVALLSSKDKVSLERFFLFILTVGFVLTIWLLYRFATT